MDDFFKHPNFASKSRNVQIYTQYSVNKRNSLTETKHKTQTVLPEIKITKENYLKPTKNVQSTASTVV